MITLLIHYHKIPVFPALILIFYDNKTDTKYN